MDNGEGYRRMWAGRSRSNAYNNSIEFFSTALAFVLLSDWGLM